MFSKFNLFKKELNQSLNNFEFKFLIKTFSYGAVGFFSFALLLLLVWSFDSIFQFSQSHLFPFLSFLFSICCTVGFFYFFSRYRDDPVGTEMPFITKTFALLICSYVFIFLMAFQMLSSVLKLDSFPQKIFLTFFVFGTTTVLYAIPAAIGFFIQKHQTAMTLAKFLKYCYFLYFLLFLLFLIFAITTGVFTGTLSVIVFLLLGVIIFLSPVLTIYRLKNTVRFIDHLNPEAVYKWELFFAIEILVQLMQMAIYVVRLLLILLGRSDRG